MKQRTLTAVQVLKRMAAGDCPHSGGGYSDVAYFDDGSRVASSVMYRLVKQGKVARPVGTSVENRWTVVPRP